MYSRGEVQQFIERYAALVAAVDRDGIGPREGVLARLLDLDAALAQLEDPEFEVLTLRALQGASRDETALSLRLSPSTVSRRYRSAIDVLVQNLNAPSAAPSVRQQTGWWEWALGDDAVPEGQRRRGGRGRPPSTTPTTEDQIVVWACGGATERQIAEALDVPRSTVQSVLKRFGVPRPPRGQRPTPGRYSPMKRAALRPGDAYCAPESLIAAYREAQREAASRDPDLPTNDGLPSARRKSQRAD